MPYAALLVRHCLRRMRPLHAAGFQWREVAPLDSSTNAPAAALLAQDAHHRVGDDHPEGGVVGVGLIPVDAGVVPAKLDQTVVTVFGLVLIRVEPVLEAEGTRLLQQLVHVVGFVAAATPQQLKVDVLVGRHPTGTPVAEDVVHELTLVSLRPAFVILVTEDERTCCECSGDHHEHGDYDESAAHTGGDATGSPHDRVRHHAGQPRAAIYVLDD
jgi:hypothetical protein